MEKETLNELARMRKLAGLNESFGGVAEAPAADQAGMPPQDEVAKFVAMLHSAIDEMEASGAITPELMAKMNEDVALDEGMIPPKMKKAMKMFGTVAMWLGAYNLLGPALDAVGVPHPDLSHISYDVLGLVSPDSGAEQGYGGPAY